MAHVKEGDRIAVRYTAVASDRRILASTRGGSPLVFTAGGDDVLYGLSHGVIGMAPGEKAVLLIDAEDAFGVECKALQRTIPKSKLPPGIRIGDGLHLSDGGAAIVMWVIDEDGDDSWLLSAQHPFAGQDIELHVEVVAA